MFYHAALPPFHLDGSPSLEPKAVNNNTERDTLYEARTATCGCCDIALNSHDLHNGFH